MFFVFDAVCRKDALSGHCRIEIYVPFGEKADYQFGVPVSVTLKDDSEEVFYRLNGQEGCRGGDPLYTVTCKLFGIFPVKKT